LNPEDVKGGSEAPVVEENSQTFRETANKDDEKGM
jgi:hypothetical protein